MRSADWLLLACVALTPCPADAGGLQGAAAAAGAASTAHGTAASTTAGAGAPASPDMAAAGIAGAAARGRDIALDPRRGDCGICHLLPGTDNRFQGNVGPPLQGVATRLDADVLRARIEDPRAFDADSAMPAYGVVGGNRVAPAFAGRPLLGAGEIADVVAWLQAVAEPSASAGAAAAPQAAGDAESGVPEDTASVASERAAMTAPAAVATTPAAQPAAGPR
jgi:sulfur-oxidizing protein SoxX